jgi:alkylation response protein AidB-like acyl-CoA dehydrogenase
MGYLFEIDEHYRLREQIRRFAGTCAGLGSHGIATPPIIRFGTDEQKQRFVLPVLQSTKIASHAYIPSAAARERS